MKRIGTASDGKFIVLVDPAEAAELQTAAGKILAALNGFAPVTAGDPREERVHIATRLEQFSSRRPAKRKTFRKSGNKPASGRKSAAPAAGNRVCGICKKALPDGCSPLRKAHEGACMKRYLSQKAAERYAAAHQAKPAAPGTPVAVGHPVVSDAARKIAAMREARLLEADRIASLDQ
jgi:hypothetical protein